jgi:transcriptional regulator with XRE-family HTH domain
MIDNVSYDDTMFLMNERVIGHNIRALRQRAGLSLETLAKRSDLTKGTLSKIETGQVSSPISTLMRVADGLGVRLAEFFQELDQSPPYVVTRSGKGPVIAQTGSKFGYAYEALALDMRQKQAEPFILTIKPGDPVGEFRHGGQEFIYLLSGKLRFTVGEDEIVLGKGDALYFDPSLTHTTKVMGKNPARFLCLFIQDPTRPDSSRMSK